MSTLLQHAAVNWTCLVHSACAEHMASGYCRRLQCTAVQCMLLPTIHKLHYNLCSAGSWERRSLQENCKLKSAGEPCSLLHVATVLNWNLSTALLQVVLDYVAPLQCKVYWCTPKWREQWNVQCGTTAVHWCTAISPLQRHLQLIFAWLASCHPWTTPSKGTFAIITMLHKHCKCIYMAFHFSEQ